MFKRIIACLLTILLLASFSACTESKNSKSEKSSGSEGSSESRESFESQNESSEESEDEIKHTGKKLEGKIIASSEFSEGFVLIQLENDTDTTYCVDKDGYIVFELHDLIVANYYSDIGYIYEYFSNGFIELYDGGLCDTTGKVTYPEDVGATKFYTNAIEGNYIIAEKITPNNGSTIKELGVMDLSFNWIFEPTEAFYNAWEQHVKNELGTFYYNDHIYCSKSSVSFNLKNGEIGNEQPDKIPSSTWKFKYHQYNVFGPNEDVMLDLSAYPALDYVGEFINGKALVTFYDNDAEYSSFTLIDENGSFLFAPIGCGYDKYSIEYDGSTILVCKNGKYGSKTTAKTYSEKGELIAELDTSTFNNDVSVGLFSNGVMVIFENNGTELHYYDINFNPLF